MRKIRGATHAVMPVCMICALPRASHSEAEGFCPILSAGALLGFNSLAVYKECEHPRRARRHGAPWSKGGMVFHRWTSTCVVCGHRRRFSRPSTWRPEGWEVAA